MHQKTAIVPQTLRPFAKITAMLLAGNEPDGKRPDQRVEVQCDGQQIVVDGAVGSILSAGC
jgi:hypothetical protein